MRRNGWKWAVLGGALTFLILYGIEVSTAGIERIYGPIEGQPATQNETVRREPSNVEVIMSETDRKIAALERELAELKRLASGGGDFTAGSGSSSGDNPRLPGIPYVADQPPVQKLADSTSSLLQSMSTNGIRFVVSIFDGLTN